MNNLKAKQNVIEYKNEKKKVKKSIIRSRTTLK